MDQISARGQVEVELVAPDGVRTPVSCGHNTLSYRCSDAVARLFAGQLAVRPAKIAFVLEDFELDSEDARRQETIGEGKAVEDVALDPNPAFSASDATAEHPEGVEYRGNVVRFTAMTVDNAAAKTVYGFLLKAEDGTVLAARKLGTTVQKPQNYALSASWSVTFN